MLKFNLLIEEHTGDNTSERNELGTDTTTTLNLISGSKLFRLYFYFLSGLPLLRVLFSKDHSLFWQGLNWRNSNVIITNANCDTHKITFVSAVPAQYLLTNYFAFCWTVRSKDLNIWLSPLIYLSLCSILQVSSYVSQPILWRIRNQHYRLLGLLNNLVWLFT